MKKILFLFVFIIGGFTIFAQDVIVLKDGTEIKAKIVVKTADFIKYRDFDNQQGDVKIIEKSKVEKIIYKKGDVEMIAQPPKQDSSEEIEKANIPVSDSLRKVSHLVTVSLNKLVMRMFGFSYELITKNDKFGIRIPFAFKPKSKYYDAGIDFRYYLKRGKYSKYTLGPHSLGLARFSYFLGPFVSCISEKESISLFPSLENGFTFEFNKGFTLSALLSLGASGYLSEKGVKSDYFNTMDFNFYWDISVGWRFSKK
ncbi:MAG: hypothetical protein HY738_14760 [Bacteroidia bacterium]|nr:hypothetical protein [Bacteroidia bacterium]